MSTTEDRSTVETARDHAPDGPRVAVVTGAARGIGEAIAHRLGRDGLHVVAADLPSMQEGVAATVEAITAAGGTATAAETDVSEEASVQTLVETAVEAGGNLDVFVANAGIAQVQELIDYSKADFEKIVDVNLTGVFLSYPAGGEADDRAGQRRQDHRRRLDRRVPALRAAGPVFGDEMGGAGAHPGRGDGVGQARHHRQRLRARHRRHRDVGSHR
jgi:NAD(P)-dependent dehydrogenase (short-subunit alcohol dehydrogenase family)